MDEIEVEAVLNCKAGECGLLWGADDEEDDSPSRAKSTLKLESLDSGGKGEELLRIRVWVFTANGSWGERLSVGEVECFSKILRLMMGLCRPCADVILLPGNVGTGADA